MAQPLSWAETIRQATPASAEVDRAQACGDDAAFMWLLLRSALAIAGHLDRIATAIEREGV